MIDPRLSELGIELSAPARPVGRYASYVRTGNLIWSVQGQLVGNRLAFQGKLGASSLLRGMAYRLSDTVLQ